MSGHDVSGHHGDISGHGDVSVRPAAPEDAAVVTGIQLRAWRAHHGDALGPDLLTSLDVEAIREQWARAITAPPSAAHRVLVACDGPRVVGFAAAVPSGPAPNDPAPGAPAPGSEVLALEVDPEHQRRGHGSRLLTACVDLARADGAVHLSTWVLQGDSAREQFLTACGLGADGARRDLGTDAAAPVSEYRWVAEI